MCEACQKCALVFRSLAATSLALVGVGSLVVELVRPRPEHWAIPASALLCATGLAWYCLELRRRQVWFAARRCFQRGQFSEYAQLLRDAAPLIEFEAPGQAPAPYTLAQWQDETSWVDFGMNVKRGTVLASFPLEFVPGDHAEASALEFAMSNYAEETTQGAREAEKLRPQVDLRLRLRWPDGAETEAPDPELLNSGPTGAEWLCPGLLLLACLCLMGLIFDVVLLCVAEPVEWPVRKRFFTLPGARVGALSFTCTTDGSVAVAGELEELRAANRFWIRNDDDWHLVEKEVAQLAPMLLRLRRLRVVGQVLAVAAALATAGGLAYAGEAAASPRAGAPLLVGVSTVLGFWGLSCCLEWLAKRRTAAVAERLGTLLPGGATVTTTWGSSGFTSGSELSIGVEQLKPVGANKELPVLKSLKSASCTSTRLSGP